MWGPETTQSLFPTGVMAYGSALLVPMSPWSMYAMPIDVFVGLVLLRYPWPQSIVIESPHMGAAWAALVYPPAGGGASGIHVQPLLPCGSGSREP